MQVDLKGQVFGQWRVVERGQRKNYWLCECSCGRKFEVRGTHLQEGASTKCLPCRYESQKLKYRRNGPTDAEKETWKRYRRTARGKYSLLKRKSKYRSIPFNLTFEEYEGLIQGNACFYCGDPLAETGVGLDRRNRELGYTSGNVVPACAPCNAQKGYLEGAGFSPERVLGLMQELKAAGVKISLSRKPRPWRKTL